MNILFEVPKHADRFDGGYARFADLLLLLERQRLFMKVWTALNHELWEDEPGFWAAFEAWNDVEDTETENFYLGAGSGGL